MTWYWAGWAKGSGSSRGAGVLVCSSGIVYCFNVAQS